MTGLVFLDQRLVPLEEARLSPLNTALFFGESLFETIPVYGGKPLFFKEHLERLKKGALFLGWPSFSRRIYEKAIRLYTAQTTGSFAIRFNLVQETPSPVNPRYFSHKRPRILAVVRPLRHQPEEFHPRTGRIGISPWVVPGSLSVPGQFKWIFYMMIRRDFRLHPQWDEMLRLNEVGHVVDGGAASPLWFLKGTVYAPSLKEGGLESVTREKVLGLCRVLGVRIVEKAWKPSDILAKGGELFFVGSGVGILGASHLQGKPLPSARPMTLRLWQHYRTWALQKTSF